MFPTELIKYIRKSDVILEVLDGREPELTRSIKLEEIALRYNKKLVLVMNKSDLVPPTVIKKWIQIYENQGLITIPYSIKKNENTKILKRGIKSLQSKEKIKCILVGYPKTGKSSIINSLKGYKSTKVSPIPRGTGSTLQIQLFKISGGLYIWDSPGVIPPDGSPLERIIRGTPPEKLENPVKVAVELIRRITGLGFKHRLQRKYNVVFSTELELIEGIAKKRHLIYSKDKELNIDEASRVLLRDFYNNEIFYYDLPPTINLLEKRRRL
ncbi:GTP-binding protein [Sulfolobales archaeon HS-7]|nr:GTP-binding protein [Sulfolobales archaeon HS-7]